MVEVRSPSGAALTIGLGHELSVATFAASASTPPYFVSKGDGGQGSPLVFFRDGHWSEFDSDAAISAAVAREAAISFVSTGERPANVRWSEV
jgi:hypothetical protein